MAKLSNFKFYSHFKLDGEIEKIKFEARGYVDKKTDQIIYYFKNDNDYKFIIKNDIVEVSVNESFYSFVLNKKTEALINNAGYLYKASVVTNKLVILDNKVEIEYVMDFVSFKGVYKIILELY